MQRMYIITEFDFDGIAFCSHIRWEVAEACDKHREIFAYGGTAEIKYRYVNSSVCLP